MERVRKGMQKIAAELLSAAPAHQAALLAWPLVCGATVAGKTKALDFRQGELRILVPDAGWRQELAALTPQYFAALQGMTAREIKKISFVLPQEK